MTERKVSFNPLPINIQEPSNSILEKSNANANANANLNANANANLNLENIKLKRDFIKKLLTADFQDKDVLLGYWESYAVLYLSILHNIEIEQQITEPKLKAVILLLKNDYFATSKRNLQLVVSKIASLDMTEEVITFIQYFLQL
jgi:hypothetical protein